MSEITNQTIIDYLLDVEGWPKYTNNPNDKGGPTRGGITLRTLRSWPGYAAAEAETLKSLPDYIARQIYANMYIETPKFDKIDDALLRWQIVDAGVLHGPARTKHWLQEAVGLTGSDVDGILGPKTLSIINNMPTLDPWPDVLTWPDVLAIHFHSTALKFAAIRLRFIASIVHGDHSQAVWINGWTARATKFIELEAERELL